MLPAAGAPDLPPDLQYSAGQVGANDIEVTQPVTPPARPEESFERGDGELVGRRFGDRFVIREFVGAGAHGAVYAAWDERLKRSVALKTLLDLEPDELVRFKREFRILSNVSHPNLVALHELFVTDEGAFFTMELVDGTDFMTWLRGEELDTLDEGRLRDTMRELARGLSALHGFGLLHRDLKPSNVLVREDGEVLLADFGLARSLAGDDVEPGLVGTPAYMSPEQAADQALTEASDWYSVGVMLYEALTGAYPFGGLSGMGLMMAKQLRTPDPPSLAESGVPSDLDGLCHSLLARDPADRPEGAQVMAMLGALGPEVAPAAAPGALDPAFVGRDGELARLRSAWASVCERDAERREGAVVMLRGPSGGGKSSLLRHFVQDVDPQRAVVLHGRCYERESVPYKGLDVLVDALRSHLLADRTGVAADLEGSGALVRLFPVLADVPGIGGQGAVVEDPVELRRQAVGALRELLRRIATARPLLIVLDDLQWCDGDTASVLIDLLTPQHRPRLLFVGSVRSEDAALSAPSRLADGLTGIAGLRVESLEIGPLGVAASEALARDLFGSHPDAEALTKDVAREAEGNPLFLTELVRHAAAGLSASSGKAPGLDTVVRARAARLGPVARDLLAVVAVAGGPMPQALVVEAAGASERGVEAIAELRTQAFVRTYGPDLGDPIEPFHARITEAVRGSLEPPVRVRCHARLAEALESGAGDAETLAYHLREAGDTARAFDYLEAAAQGATRALAFARAARLYSVALDLLPSEDPRRGGLLESLADAHAYDGRGLKAAEAYRRAAELADAGAVLPLRRAAAEQLLRSGHIERGEAELRAVLTELGLYAPRTPRRALLAFLGLRSRLALRGTEFDERPDTEVDATNLLTIDTTWAAAAGLLQANVFLGQYFQTKHLLLALEGGEPHRVARALGMETLYAATAGAKGLARTDGLLEQLEGLARRLDDPRTLGVADLASGVADVYRGRFATAWPKLERAEEVLRQRCKAVHYELAMVRTFSCLSLSYLGDFARMREVLRVSLEDARDRDDLHTRLMLETSFTPLLALVDGDVARARTILDDLLAEHGAALGSSTYRYARLLSMGRIARYERRGAEAWAAFGEHWGAVRGSLMLTKQPFRIFAHHERALAALACAHESEGATRRRTMSAAERSLGVLRREGTRWARAVAAPTAASLAAARGNAEGAARELLMAERLFAESGMDGYATCAHRRRGELLGGDAGARMVEAADADLEARGVQDPAAVADLFLPTVSW